MSLLPDERTQIILQALYRDGRLLVEDAAREMNVSGETIRRDLKRLEKAGLLKRSHGGAVPVPPRQAEDFSYPARSVLNIAAKRRIAAAAARHISDDQALTVDSSSTALELVRALEGRKGLTIVTNSVALLTDPASLPHRLISVGGERHPDIMTFRGPLAVEAARRFHADLAIVSVKALSKRSGLMVANAEEAELKRIFIENAGRTLLLIDGDKFDGSGLVSVAPLSAVSTLITDREPQGDWRRLVEDAGVTLEVAP